MSFCFMWVVFAVASHLCSESGYFSKYSSLAQSAGGVKKNARAVNCRWAVGFEVGGRSRDHEL